MRRDRFHRGLCAAAGVLLIASSAAALEVRDALWGFDGKVMPGRFNPVSVLLENPSPSAYDGALLLHRTDGLGGRVGEEIVEPCYLAPFTARWVQFDVYVREEDESWVLTWDPKRGGREVLPAPRLGPPACVCLQDPESVSQVWAGLKRFPDNLFPSCVSAAETLHSVVLDHVPHWEAARRQAFMDWARAGGIVHLAQDATGKYPVFPEDMSELNAPGERLRVGAGLIVRHPAAAREIGENFLAVHGFPMPELNVSEKAMMGGPEDLLFDDLKSMTRPADNWSIIYGLLAVYVILVVPVNFYVGRKWRDYRRTIAFCLVAVALFAWLFSVVGRRGYGESTAIHTLSYARPLGHGAWDVSQWTNVFVIDGAYYTLTHPCPQNLYSTCSQMESVNGTVQNGRDGNFRVDIPLYSSRALLHRGRFSGPDLSLNVVTWKGGEQLESFAVEGAPPNGMVEAWAFYRGCGYPMAAFGGRIQTAGAGRPAEQFFPPDQFTMFQFGGRMGRIDSEDLKTDERFQKMLRPLMARAVGGAGVFRHEFVLPQAGDAVQLFLFARAPDSLKMTQSGLGREEGYVLYHLTFYKPET
ncbi:MAG: hypothetical protein ABSA67_07915 [Candidatus Brocadiia bacterium]